MWLFERHGRAALLVFSAALALSLLIPAPALPHSQDAPKEKPVTWREVVARPAPAPAPALGGLIDQFRRPFALASTRGKVLVVAFLYTSCPDLCPLTTDQMARLQGMLGAEAPVHFVSVTTEPEVDAPEVLWSYGERFGADFSNWSFLTGELAAVRRVWRAFRVNVAREGRGLVQHTYLLALIDRRGRWRVSYWGETWSLEQVLRDIRALVRSSPGGGEGEGTRPRAASSPP